MAKVSRFWLWVALILLGYSGGIITGVVVDADQVYHTTIKNIKQKRSGGQIIIDTSDPVKSKKEIRKEKRAKRRADRQEPLTCIEKSVYLYSVSSLDSGLLGLKFKG